MQLLAFIVTNEEYNIITNVILDPVTKLFDNGSNYHGNYVIMLIRKSKPQTLLNDIEQEVCSVIVFDKFYFNIDKEHVSSWKS